MFNIDILTLFAFLGTFQGLIFSVIFWKKNKNISNRIFALLMLVTSVRIAKNIFVHLSEINPEVFSPYQLWHIVIYIGLSHQFAIGPLFLLYFMSKTHSKFFLKKKYFWHFLPYFFFVLISPFINWNFWSNGGLLLSYISILIYYVLVLNYYYQHKNIIDRSNVVWLRGLLIIAGVLLFVYSPALFNYMGYIGGAFLYAIAILSVGYVLFIQKGTTYIFRKKYQSSSLEEAKATEIKVQLQEIMHSKKPFLNPELTLQSLANTISVPPYQLSQVINQEFKKSYADYINTFRLNEAVKRLKNAKYDHLKISALAYDSGFNSQPTFNTLFKRNYNITPSQFRSNYRNL